MALARRQTFAGDIARAVLCLQDVSQLLEEILPGYRWEIDILAFMIA